MPVTSKKIGEKIFVKMNATYTLLICAVAGHRVHGMISRSTLLTTLQSFVDKACNGELDTLSSEEEVGDEYDPMQEIEELLDDGAHQRSRGGGTPRSAPCIHIIKQTTCWLPRLLQPLVLNEIQ